MRNKFFLTATIFIVALLIINGQTKSKLLFNYSKSTIDTVDYNYLKKKYPLTNTTYLKNFEAEIIAYENNDKIKKPDTAKIEFIGSSIIKLWNYRLQKDMNPLPVFDRGFGGSQLLQNIFYFDRLVKPYKPSILVFYCGNDFASEPNQIFELFRYYEYLFHEKFPNSMLYIVSFMPSIARKDYIQNVEKANHLIEAYMKTRPNTGFIDIFYPMIPNGKLNTNLLASDSLHLNDKGYDLWTSIIKPIISAKYASISTSCPNFKEDDIKIFNLGEGKFQILGLKKIISLSVYDISGKKVLWKNNSSIEYFDLSENRQGTYIITLQTSDKEIITKKIVLTAK